MSALNTPRLIGAQNWLLFRVRLYSKSDKIYRFGGKNAKVTSRDGRNQDEDPLDRLKVVLDRGLGAVGVRDVVAGANLTPGGFYRHFRSRDRLIAEASSAALDRAFAMLEGETAGKAQAQAVDRIVSVYLGQSQVAEKPYLCPLAMIGAELRHTDPQVRAIAINGYQRIVQRNRRVVNCPAAELPRAR